MSRICALVAVLAIVVASPGAPGPLRDARAQEPAVDAGVAPPSGTDAGVAVAPAPETVAKPEQADPEVEQMRRELEVLRAQVASLQAQAAQTEQLVSEASQINEQIVGLREQLAAVEGQAAEREAEEDQAIATLLSVQQELLYGDTPDMDWRLADAAAVLGSPARDHIEWARTALANKDGANARWYLSAAILAAQRQR